MRFAEYLAHRRRAAQVPEHREYPKWVIANGKNVLVSDAQEEAEFMGPEPDAALAAPPNLLSGTSPRRGPGRPKKTPSPEIED